MHAVLDLETYRPDAQYHEALKERLGQTGTGGLLTHDHGAQLTVITNKHQLKGTMSITKKPLQFQTFYLLRKIYLL